MTSSDMAIFDCIAVNRNNLGLFINGFIQAVELFELLERGGQGPSAGVLGGKFIQYRIIAAKEGAMNIYHFGCSLDALRHQIKRCEKTKKTVDALKIKLAYSLLEKYFPHRNNTRHAIAHAGEIWKSPITVDEHRQKSDYTSKGGFSAAEGFLLAMLYERTYSVGWEGKVFEVHMDSAAIEKLQEIWSVAESAFPQYP